jgi:hypothetical protein
MGGVSGVGRNLGAVESRPVGRVAVIQGVGCEGRTTPSLAGKIFSWMMVDARVARENFADDEAANA